MRLEKTHPKAVNKPKFKDLFYLGSKNELTTKYLRDNFFLAFWYISSAGCEAIFIIDLAPSTVRVPKRARDLPCSPSSIFFPRRVIHVNKHCAVFENAGACKILYVV